MSFWRERSTAFGFWRGLATAIALIGCLWPKPLLSQPWLPGEKNLVSPRPLPINQVRITDSFWSPKLEVYRQKTIPHSWQYVQREIEDNEIAAGWRQEKRGKDTPWNQANLHKVLETVAYALAQQADPVLDKKLDGIISAITAAQQPNGYCNALITVRQMTPWANLDGQHDGYVAGHLIEAAVAHYESTGKTNFLKVATKLADHIYQHFIQEKQPGVCGHAELELALVRLYRVTGERRYLELSRDWIERRGKPWAYTTDTPRRYFMDHLPIRQVDEITGHAVRALFYATGVADVGVETGDVGLQAAARRLWHSATRRKMYVTGAVGAQEKDEGFGPDYDLPNQGGYGESCAACGLIYFANAMFRLDGESESIDVLERVLYNTALHGISLDGTCTYYRNPLSDENHPRDNCWVCCPPCLSRTLLRMPEFIYAQKAHHIYLNLYVGSTATMRRDDNVIQVTQTTEYPWTGAVAINLKVARPQSFALHLRIPGWSRNAQVKLNEGDWLKPKLDGGYAVIEREWASGDKVALELPMPVQLVKAHPRVKADQGLAAIQRGPIIYGVEGLDNGGSTDLALPGNPRFNTEYRPSLLGGVVVVTGRTTRGHSFMAVPFYALANRGNSQQAVWLRQESAVNTGADWDDTLYRLSGPTEPDKK